VTQAVRSLAETLISRRSVTPADEGCQRIVAERLQPLGFRCETIVCGEVTNLWAVRRGKGDGPALVFAGHTDVVPPGPLHEWQSDPFVPIERDGKLFGRGAADMKASIAAFVVAVEEYLASAPDSAGHIGVLLTSDEEGAAVNGTAKVVERLALRNERIDFCLVGEPTSVHHLGDTIKNGRRGSLSGRLVVKGIQGHVAYPQAVRNPVHRSAPAIAELAAEAWDEGDAFFPPTTFQISNYHAGIGAENVTPGDATIDFNFRFSPASTPETIERRVTSVLTKHHLDFTLTWNLVARPFATPPGALSDALVKAVLAETGIVPSLSTSGGISDGRFLATICSQVCELGPLNASIHRVDEHVDLPHLDSLKRIYRRVLETLVAR
jgi:succinyl-diaminopimelate desuccinylase